MAKRLILQQIRDDGRTEVGVLEGEEVYVSREPGDGITIKSQGVSRKHGIFSAIRNHWFYRDLGSTNGSWVNGAKVEKGQWKLIKNRDLIQLADVALQVVEPAEPLPGGRSFPAMGMRSLLVFSRGEFLDEYPIPEYGRALVIGGSKADLKLDVDVYELPSLVVERRGDNVCAFTIARETSVQHNGREMTHAVILADRDELRIGHYTIIYNDVPSPAGTSSYEKAASPGGPLGQEGASGGEFEDGPAEEAWRSERARRLSERLPFGKVILENEASAEETVALSPEEMRQTGFDRHPAMRHAQLEADTPSLRLEALEDKVVLIIGVVMLLMLFGLVAWWVLT